MDRGPTYRIVAMLAIGLLAGCGGDRPAAVSDWPTLESCNETGETIYMPTEQGPSEAFAASEATFNCIVNAYQTGQAREADFVLLGTEGNEFRLLVQTLDDGTINLYRETDTAEIYEGCQTLNFEGPFFSAADC
jgi:hypothetical protein